MQVGQDAYHSRISGRMEYRPVVGSIVGAKGVENQQTCFDSLVFVLGSDLMLLNLANAALSQARWSTVVSTGRVSLRLGDNDRNTED